MTTPARAPHAVSLLRPLLGAGLLVALPWGAESSLLLPVVVAACASDWLDGELARRGGGPTRTGRLIDNACDFLFLEAAFVWMAAGRLWSPPVWGRLLRYWDGANWLPVFALAASFGVYFLRLSRDFSAGREPGRSPRGHAAGVCNYLLALLGAVEVLPGVDLGPGLLEPVMLAVVILNAAAVAENLVLLFQGDGDAPKMRA